MSEKYYKNLLTNQEHIKNDLEDDGITSIDDWKEIYDTVDEYRSKIDEDLVMDPTWKERWENIQKERIRSKGINQWLDIKTLNSFFDISLNRNSFKKEFANQDAQNEGYLSFKRVIEIKKVVVETITFIEEELQKDNIDIEKIKQEIDRICVDYSLPKNIKGDFESGLKSYFYKRDAVKKTLEIYPDPNILFTKCFGIKPQGKVETFQYGASLVFRCFETEDYIKALNEDESKAQMSWGVALYGGKIPSLPNNTITVEKVLPNHKPESLWRHEEQHHLNKLFLGVRKNSYGVARLPALAEMFAKEPSKDSLEQFVVKYVEISSTKIDINNCAKDEIISQYAGGDKSLDEIKHTMQNNHLYKYSNYYTEEIKGIPSQLLWLIRSNFFIQEKKHGDETESNQNNDFYNDDDYFRKSGLVISEDMLEPIVFSVFKERYKDDVKTWIKVIENLENKNYTRREIVAILNTEDIHRWVAIGKRMPDKKQN